MMKKPSSFPAPPVVLRAFALILLVTLAFAAGADEKPTAVLQRAGQLSVSIDTAPPIVTDLPEGVRIDRSAAVGGGFVATGTERSQRLIVLKSDGTRTWSLPTPRVGGGRSGGWEVAEPIPIAVNGKLLGLAWLEGADRGSYAVRFAAWDGDRWRGTETVSARGVGSQIALAATALGDHSILLAWSAFDGQDDEIVWSRRGQGSGWSEPTAVATDNTVPDITPALATFDDQAVIAWSRFEDGQYRLVTARFDRANANGAGGFTAPVPAAGPGSLFPEFHPNRSESNDRPVLSFRDAALGAWAVIRLDSPGDIGLAAKNDPQSFRATDRITLPGSPAERPIVVGADDGGILVFERDSDRAVRLSWEPEL